MGFVSGLLLLKLLCYNSFAFDCCFFLVYFIGCGGVFLGFVHYVFVIRSRKADIY